MIQIGHLINNNSFSNNIFTWVEFSHCSEFINESNEQN